MLDNVASVNQFDYADSVMFTQGDQVDVYFQLIDANRDRAQFGFQPAGRRYMPASGATLSVKLDNVDDNVALTRTATQPFPTSDPSIWKVSILNSDAIRGTCALVLTLTQSGVVTKGRVQSAVLIQYSGTL